MQVNSFYFGCGYLTNIKYSQNMKSNFTPEKTTELVAVVTKFAVENDRSLAQAVHTLMYQCLEYETHSVPERIKKHARAIEVLTESL